MLTIAYLANQFPSPVEPYVAEEIEELRRRGVRVITGSVREPQKLEGQTFQSPDADVVILRSLRAVLLLRALWLVVSRWNRIADLFERVIFRGHESALQRAKALLHSWLGASYALLLEGRGVSHIHVHHGYFGSWIAMVAARLLGVDFSMTLHGSDLLVHKAYLGTKLQNCQFCLTVSEYNRSYILENFPQTTEQKILVTRLGVDVPECASQRLRETAAITRDNSEITLLSVGRLHAVKDHAFLLRACAQLRARGVRFECSIAGEGPERRRLEGMIQEFKLQDRVKLLGHVARERIDSLYSWADVLVLTSRSEGIPLVLMEAMARGTIVLAPAITGIPELVDAGNTGFLYEPGSGDKFLEKILLIYSLMRADRSLDHLPSIPSAPRPLDWVRHAAKLQVSHQFNRAKNLELFGDVFLRRIATQTGDLGNEDFVLQQI